MIDYVLEYEIEKLENWLDDLKVEPPTNILLAQRAIKRYKEEASSCIRGVEPDIYLVEKRNRLIREIGEKISEYRLAERRKRKEIVQMPVVPKELDTDEARVIFKRAIDAGFMNEQYKFIGTWYQAAYFAEEAAKRLKLKPKWKYFQELWGYTKLAQTRRESIERFGIVKGQDDIDKIFDF